MLSVSGEIDTDLSVLHDLLMIQQFQQEEFLSWAKAQDCIWQLNHHL